MTQPTKTKNPRRFARTPKDSGSAAEQATEVNRNVGPVSAPPEATNPKTVSKISQVIELLSRQEGATLTEMVAATGWQPHTTRAALTGLKKKGHTIERSKRGDVTCYHIDGKA